MTAVEICAREGCEEETIEAAAFCADCEEDIMIRLRARWNTTDHGGGTMSDDSEREIMREDSPPTFHSWDLSKVQKHADEYPDGECRACGYRFDLNDSAMSDCTVCGTWLRERDSDV